MLMDTVCHYWLSVMQRFQLAACSGVLALCRVSVQVLIFQQTHPQVAAPGVHLQIP